MSNERKSSSTLLRKLARMPFGTIWFGCLVGFVVGISYLVGDAVISKTWEWVNFELIGELVILLGFVVAGITKWNQKRMGERWNNQLWFEKLITMVLFSSFGIALSAVTYNIIVYIVHAKGR